MYSAELKVAQLAVKRASVFTKRISDELVAKSTSSITKTDKSPVTIGDFGAQAIIINSILKNFPQDQIVGEEDSKILREQPALKEQIFKDIQTVQSEDSANHAILGEISTSDQICEVIDQGNSEGGSKGRFWALDPIDGTKGFIRGDQFAVCLALIEDGKVQLGVIGCPNLPSHLQDPQSTRGGLFSALINQGSFYQNLFGPLQPNNHVIMLDNSIPVQKARVCEGVEKGHSSHELQSIIKSKLSIAGQSIHLDSQAKYCALSRGDAEIYLRLPVKLSYQENIWDHAAGNVLITESGGIVSDLLGNELDFGQGRTLKSKGVIAASKNVHPEIIKAIKSVVGENGEHITKYVSE